MSQSSQPSPADSRCAKCGACVPTCPLFRLTGREHVAARAKLHLLETLGPAVDRRPVAAMLGECLLCGACSARCPRNITPHHRIMAAREGLASYPQVEPRLAPLVRFCLAHPWLGRALARLTRRLPPDSGLRLRLPHLPPAAGRRPPPPQAAADIAIFHGCLAGWLETNILQATVTLLQQAGHTGHWPAKQGCCGLAAASAGQRRQAQALARRNIAAFASDERPILVTCASCYSHLRDYPRLLADDPAWRERAARFASRLQEFFCFFAETELGRTAAPSLVPSIVYHDPCHLRHGTGIVAEPRRLLTRTATVVEPASGPRCCGQGGLFHLAHPQTAGRMRARLIAGLSATGAKQIITSCSGCLLHIRSGLSPAGPLSAAHPAVLLARLLSPRREE